MFEYINDHLSGFWIAMGFALLAAEVLVFGFTTIVFVFAGLGALVTGLLMMSGILPESWIAGISCFGIATGLSSALLWKPLKNMQDQSAVERKPQSDFIGLEFVLQQKITMTQPGHYRYSGIDWIVELDRNSNVQQLNKGERVKVKALEVGVLKVDASG